MLLLRSGSPNHLQSRLAEQNNKTKKKKRQNDAAPRLIYRAFKIDHHTASSFLFLMVRTASFLSVLTYVFLDCIPSCRTRPYGQSSFTYQGPRVQNQLPRPFRAFAHSNSIRSLIFKSTFYKLFTSVGPPVPSSIVIVGRGVGVGWGGGKRHMGAMRICQCL